ncbi:hypothetical protein [Streptomyces sp. NPDC054765]
MLMIRRLAVVLTALLATGVLTTGAAVATPADGPHRHGRHHHQQHDLTPRERAGLRIAGEVLDTLFGGGPARRDRF